jgi:hypothetical protein
MKKLLFLMIAATTIAFVGCSKDDPAPDPVIEPALSVSPSSILATVAASSYDIAVTSNTAWTAAVDASAEWCTVSPANGTDNGSVTVDVTTNVAAETRVATVTFTAGALTQQVSVTQEAAAFYAASTRTWVYGDQTWSDAIQIPDCDKTSFLNSYTEPSCRNYTSGENTWYYYNWPYVAQHAASLCPSPWRVPTHADHITLANNTTDSELINAWGYGGLVFVFNGSVSYTTRNGLFWSSTENEIETTVGLDYYEYSYALGYSSSWSGIDTSDTNKHYGIQVRCVK